jgi:DNA-binding XRE family transcriptional regulator
METKIFHGNITPDELAQKLIASFNRGNLRAQKIGAGNQTIVQIATDRFTRAGGQTATAVTIQKVTDGISVQVGKQDWAGVAASLGQTAFSAFRNPLALLSRLDDLAQDIESLQLREKIWLTIQELAQTSNVSHQLSERLRRLECVYCNTANEIGAPQCVACGAPLGSAQPHTCKNCGFVVNQSESVCPNCYNRL